MKEGAEEREKGRGDSKEREQGRKESQRRGKLEKGKETEKGELRNLLVLNLGMWQALGTGKEGGHKNQLYPLFSF